MIGLRNRILVVLAMVSVVLSLALVPHIGSLQLAGNATAATPARLMIVGDSITQGSSGDYTWRYRLAKHLTAVGALFDLVGPRNDLFDNVEVIQGDDSYADPAFDRDHDAMWGRAMFQEKDTIAQEILGSQPDTLLVQLGINDLAFTSTPTQAEASLREFIANARFAFPAIRIIF